MNPDDLYIHQRKSIRLRGYNYTKHGEYFITICSYRRFHYFCEITDGVMTTTDLGRLVIEEWIKIPQHRPNLVLRDYCIMPNHFHGIIVIKSNDKEVGRLRGTTSCAPTMQFGHIPKDSIPSIIRSFKAGVTNKIMKTRSAFYYKIWQRGYYEHIIRDEIEKQRIRVYINNNVQSWRSDLFFSE
jgi:putative transposase